MNKNTCMPCCSFPKGHPGACDVPSYDCKSCDCGASDGEGVQGCCSNGYCQPGAVPQSSSPSSVPPFATKFLRTMHLPVTGTPKSLGHCCAKNRAGKSCETCAPGFFGPDCKACPIISGKTCSDHGECVTSGTNGGTCACELGWIGDACETCDEAVERKCEKDCSGPDHGQCTCDSSAKSDVTAVLASLSAGEPLPGRCKCQNPYTGVACDSCVNGYWRNGESCTKCEGCDACDSNGKCPSENEPFFQWPPTEKEYIVGGVSLFVLLISVLACAKCCRKGSPPREGSWVEYQPPDLPILPPLRASIGSVNLPGYTTSAENRRDANASLSYTRF